MRRHRFDPFSLLFGALFLSIGVAFLAGSTLAEAWHGVGPMIAVVVGTTVAAWAVAVAFRERRPSDRQPTSEAPEDDLPDRVDEATTEPSPS